MSSSSSFPSGSRLLVVAAGPLLATTAIGESLTDPFATRDQNPLVATFGLPMPLASHIDAAKPWTSRLDVNWGSTELLQASDDGEVLLVDAETFEARWTVQRALSDRLALRLEVPWRHLGAGRLDGFIDEWHDVFGLPEGARPDLPNDRMHIYYGSRSTPELDVDESDSGIGDITLGAGYELLESPVGAASLWLTVELPSGSTDDLTGNGAIDASLAITGDHRLSERWSSYGQLGITRLGDTDLLPALQKDWVWSALAGIGWRATPSLELKMQLDAHTAAYEAEGLDYFGDAVILTVGGTYRTTTGWQFDAGVSEDLAVEASPDVVFVLGLRRSW
jgi:hypothetical protein